MKTNDNSDLKPITSFKAQMLEFEFPNVLIGCAEYSEGPTGCTVFYFPKGCMTAIDIRGGSVGSIGNYDWNTAICLAGGSLYGLEAATGVSAELYAMRGYLTGFMDIVDVSGAIIYDYSARDNGIYPDKNLGRAAVRSARSGSFPIGRHGAGCFATVGKMFGSDKEESSGQGGAFCQVGATKIVAFTVVNSLGAIVNRKGELVRGNFDRMTGLRLHPIEAIQKSDSKSDVPNAPRANTTLTIVVTNQKMAADNLRQFSRQVHSSMARAIQPFHTIYDGDILYAVTTNEIENPNLNDIALGILASELVWDAILSISSEQ